MVHFSDHTKCISLSNQPCMTWPTLINVNLDKYNQGFCYYPSMVNLDRCNESCNTLDDPSGRIFVPNKTKYGNLNFFNMIIFVRWFFMRTTNITCKFF